MVITASRLTGDFRASCRLLKLKRPVRLADAVRLQLVVTAAVPGSVSDVIISVSQLWLRLAARLCQYVCVCRVRAPCVCV